MGAYSFEVATEFKTTTCCVCGQMFAMNAAFYDRRREKKDNFYCPAGHSQHFTGDTEADKLRRELENEKRLKQFANERAERNAAYATKQEHKVRAMKGVLTKTKKRIANGVCPCCNRTFQNLANHMKTKHPHYESDGVDA